jgi:hypothetical protein
MNTPYQPTSLQIKRAINVAFKPYHSRISRGHRHARKARLQADGIFFRKDELGTYALVEQPNTYLIQEDADYAADASYPTFEDTPEDGLEN